MTENANRASPGVTLQCSKRLMGMLRCLVRSAPVLAVLTLQGRCPPYELFYLEGSASLANDADGPCEGAG
jgi:hypothetical protein